MHLLQRFQVLKYCYALQLTKKRIYTANKMQYKYNQCRELMMEEKSKYYFAMKYIFFVELCIKHDFHIFFPIFLNFFLMRKIFCCRRYFSICEFYFVFYLYTLYTIKYVYSTQSMITADIMYKIRKKEELQIFCWKKGTVIFCTNLLTHLSQINAQKCIH